MTPANGFTLALLLVATVAVASPPRTVIGPRTNALNKADPPFSAALRVADTLYLSGQS